MIAIGNEGPTFRRSATVSIGEIDLFGARSTIDTDCAWSVVTIWLDCAAVGRLIGVLVNTVPVGSVMVSAENARWRD